MATLAFSPLMPSVSVSSAVAKSAPGIGALFAAWRAERRHAREDRELWALAQMDPRVMTDLACARSRED
ncbi:MAG: hypothetical protein ACTS8S_06585 [Giesbergeria sp.]